LRSRSEIFDRSEHEIIVVADAVYQYRRLLTLSVVSLIDPRDYTEIQEVIAHATDCERVVQYVFQGDGIAVGIRCGVAVGVRVRRVVIGSGRRPDLRDLAL
jgi:hypothetical protein